VISLKKYLDMETGSLGPREPDPNDLACAALDSYGSVLLAMGKSGVRACPALGSDLHGGLTSLEKRLSAKISAALVRNTKSMLRSTCTNGQAGAVKGEPRVSCLKSATSNSRWLPDCLECVGSGSP
jgi:hypothetical protein